MAEASLLIKQREMNLIKNKYLFAGIVTLFAFFSCQKEELQGNSSDSIRFNVKVAEIKNAATRSTLHTGNTLTSGSFGVLGYCVPHVPGTQSTEDLIGASKTWDEKKDNSHPDVLYKQKVDISNGSTTYEYKHPESGTVIGGAAPWVTTYANGSDPATYTYSFFAYYPFEDGVWTVVTPQSQLGTPQFAFSMPFNSTNTNTSLADANIKDVMVAATYDRTCFDGAVPLNFNHVLTGINVRAQNANTSGTIYITSVTLKGTFNKTVTIDFSDNPTRVDGNYKGTFTFYSNTSGQTLSRGSTINIGNGKTILLLPHYEYGLGVDENNDVTLIVSYKTSTSYWAETNTREISLKGFRPVAGINYTLNLVFARSAIQLSVTPGENWEDGGDSNSTIK
jgi:hypothetical protein